MNTEGTYHSFCKQDSYSSRVLERALVKSTPVWSDRTLSALLNKLFRACTLKRELYATQERSVPSVSSVARLFF